MGTPSENPVLDALWAETVEDWKEPTAEDSVALQSYMEENILGCIKFIQVCFLSYAISKVACITNFTTGLPFSVE